MLTYSEPDPNSWLPRESLLFSLIGGSFDLKQFDDSEFLPTRKAVAAEDNGYGDLVRAGVLEEDPELDAELKILKDMVKGRAAWNGERVSKILKGREDELVALEDALAKPRIQLPTIEHVEDSQAEVFAILRLMSLQEGKIRFLAKAQDWKAALDEIEYANWFSKRVVEGEGGLIAVLVGVAGELAVMTELERVLKHPDFPAALLPRAQQILRDEADHTKAVTYSWQSEYFMLRNTLEEHIGGVLSLFFVLKDEDGEESSLGLRFRRHVEQLMLSVAYQPLKTRSLAVDCFSYYVQLSEVDRPSRDKVARPVILDQLERENWRQLVGVNVVGRMFLGVALPEGEKVVDRTDGVRAYRRALRVLVALRQYEAREGRLPSKLKLLERDLGGELPVDPYSGKSFGFSKGKRLLWSAGEDGKNDGGKAIDDLKGGMSFGHRKMRAEPTIQLSWNSAAN